MVVKKLRIRIVKYKRLIKPYEIEVGENHKKYVPLGKSRYYSDKPKTFWTEESARKFIKRLFSYELMENAQIKKTFKYCKGKYE